MTEAQKLIKKYYNWELEIKPDYSPDKIINHKDGTVEFRKSYYYRHGNTAEKWQNAIANDLQKLLDAKLISHLDCVWSADNWKPWPRDSYFQAIFEVS